LPVPNPPLAQVSPHLSVSSIPLGRLKFPFVIVGLPTNNLVVAEGQDISDLEAEFYEH